MEFEGANIGSILQKETILFNLFLVLPEKILNPKKIFQFPSAAAISVSNAILYDRVICGA